MLTRTLIFVFIFFILGFYAFQAIKNATKQQWIYWLYVLVTIIVIGNFIYQFFLANNVTREMTKPKTYAFTFVMILFVFQLFTVLFLFIEDIVRFFIGVYEKIVGSTGEFHLPTRRDFLSKIALGIAAIPFGALLYGMYKGKYNFKVLKYELEFDDLPSAFDGYQITQISDIHSGSFDNREKIEYAVDLINKQQSDVLFFTGDMVNNKAEEMVPWKNVFAKLKAKDGVYSVLGNHDYGDYVDWGSKEAKAKNLEDLKKLQKEMGFDLLLNDSRYLQKGEHKIALVGVENWGKGGFKKAGNLQHAAAGIHKDDFKILLSHDPSHWEQKVINDAYHYHLTLSGHTHGMQFGIEIPGWFKWSPVKWRYKYWAGIYKEMGQYINVNRGFGFLGWPEITVITLKKKSLT